MKRFIHVVAIAVFGLFFTYKAESAHLIGGEITYKYIGDSTNIAHHYQVFITLHRTTRWTTFSNVMGPNVCVRSSCFPNQTVNLSVVPGTPTNGQPVSGQTECIASNAQNFTEVIEHFLTGTVVLGGTCSDFRFSYAFLCCRIGWGNVTNYTGGVGNTNYLEARLNNTVGENTSPSFLAPPAKSFCTNNFFNWSQATIEPDGDSLEYDLGVAMNGTSCGPGNNANFNAPYTRTNPIPTVNPIFINQQFGIFEFETTGQLGNFIVVIDVFEYRLHPTGGFYYEVGRVMREMFINIVDNCLPIVQNGPQFDTNMPGQYLEDFPTSILDIIGRGYDIPNSDSTANTNSPTGYVVEDWPVIEYQCFDSVITLEFSQNVQCPTISDDASEFRMVAADCTLVPIVGVAPQCNAALETKTINLILHEPLAEEGDYYLYIKEGTDGNTLLNACGFAMPEYSSLVIRVVDCPDPEYDIKNVSVLNDDHIRIFWEPDPTTFPVSAITGWYFFRSDDGGANFNRIGSVTNNAGATQDWIDYSVDNDDVNSQTYRYQLQMTVGKTFFFMTRDITSILLEAGDDFLQGRNTWNIRWNDYDGWVAPEYNVMIYDRDSNANWVQLNQADNPTTVSSFDIEHQFLEDRRGSVFGLRVDAHDNNPTGSITYISKSNVIYFEIPTVEPEIPIEPVVVDDLNIPNVFTPNGDGENDIFIIKGVQRFRNAEVTITNRWGNVVYRSNNFQNTDGWDGRDMRSGQLVSDGTYYFIIRLRDSNDGQPDVEETGSLTIFGAGSR